MAEFTVILLQPDYLAETYGQDVLYYRLDARDGWAAVPEAQRQAYEEDPQANDPTDFHPLCVIKGHPPVLCHDKGDWLPVYTGERL